METVKSRSESPFPKSKTKDQQPPDIPENGETVIEQIKTKKKSQRHKQKASVMEQENGDSGRNGNDLGVNDVEISTQHENNDKENEHDIENDIENRTQKAEEVGEDKKKEKDALNNVQESLDNASNSEKLEGPTPDGSSSYDESKKNNTEVSEENGDNPTVNETESSAKKDITENSVEGENLEEKTNGDMHSNSSEENQEEDSTSVADASHSAVNGSDDANRYEDPCVQASPDQGIKEESFFSHKISNFLGKWNSPEIQDSEKQDSEISSSKKTSEFQSCAEEVLIHPYLSKVSGRRGIKERLNSSMSSLSSVQEEMKTPTNSGSLLDDSFRVRTNPPRLNSSELKENPTLRKFKGKRCLNAKDEPEDEDEDVYSTTTKRLKLETDGQEPGLLGSILWSSFKKKPPPTENPLKLTNTESKLSRFLSPFWFWKKTAEGQTGK